MVEKDFRGPKSKVVMCELGPEMPFLFASQISGFGNRSCVANAQREGT